MVALQARGTPWNSCHTMQSCANIFTAKHNIYNVWTSLTSAGPLEALYGMSAKVPDSSKASSTFADLSCLAPLACLVSHKL